MGVMPGEKTPGSRRRVGVPITRRAQAVRLVRQLLAELGTEHGTEKRVATQLGWGVEFVRSWMRQADIDDDVVAGTTSSNAAELKALRQEVERLRRTNAILKSLRRLSSRRSSTAHRDDGQLHRRAFATSSGSSRAGLCAGDARRHVDPDLGRDLGSEPPGLRGAQALESGDSYDNALAETVKGSTRPN
jgi:transposase